MQRRKVDEPTLCPKCPRVSFLHLVRSESYTRTPTVDSAMKMCAKLRSLNLPKELECPHYPKSESITNYLFGVKPKRKAKQKGFDYQRTLGYTDYYRVRQKQNRRRRRK